MPITIPTPETLLGVIWIGIGIAMGRGFGKQLDQDIQASDWFKKQPQPIQNIVKRMLDFLHHWYIGGLLMVYYEHIPEIYWFGLGLFLDDLPDIPPRLLSFLTGWSQYMGNGGNEEEEPSI